MAKTKDEISDDIMSVINKAFKNTPNAFEYMSDANVVTDWCPTGCEELDLIISNKRHAGLPFSKVVEIFGASASSKSLIAAHILKETQTLGGVGVYYDTESALGTLDFYKSIGLDPSKILYSDKLRTVEEIFNSIETIIKQASVKYPEKYVTIVVDSIMGATTLTEQESDFEIDGYATRKAIALSKAMRKIPDLIKNRKILLVLINQIRDNVNAIGFGADKTQTSGGKAVPFTSSVRLKTSVIKRLKGDINGVETEVGNIVEVKVVKNRLGPPARKCTFTLYYTNGIDKEETFINSLKNLEIVKTSGSNYSFEYDNPETAEREKITFTKRNYMELITSRPELREYLYNLMADKLIMEYDESIPVDLEESDD